MVLRDYNRLPDSSEADGFICPTKLRHESLPAQKGLPTARSFCQKCYSNLDRPQNWDSKVDQHAIVALTQFESMLRTALAEQGVPNFDNFEYAYTDLFDPVRDLAWALMRPVPGTSRRALHFMQTMSSSES
jgi:hypothetical protein